MNIFDTYKYTEHNRSHFQKDVDPENNCYNSILSTSSKYCAEQQFNNDNYYDNNKQNFI